MDQYLYREIRVSIISDDSEWKILVLVTARGDVQYTLRTVVLYVSRSVYKL